MARSLLNMTSFLSRIYRIYFVPILYPVLLIVAEKDLDGQPVVVAHFEALRHGVNLLDLVVRQAPAVDIKVALDAGGRYALGDDAPALLHAPDEQHLLDRLALGVGNGLEGVVGVEGRVGRAQARVAGAVDALGLVVGDELGRGVAGVQLNLVDGGNNLNTSAGFLFIFFFES